MKQADHPNGKHSFDIRKRAMNGKLFQNYQKPKQQLILNTKKTMGKKYMQEGNIFKQRQQEAKKQHREIVMSEQFIRSSKLYRLLRQKMDRSDGIYIKQVNRMNESKIKLKEQIEQIRGQNYREKVSLWELKNRLMELKIMYNEEEEESKRLGEENYGEYEGEVEEEGEYKEDGVVEDGECEDRGQDGEYKEGLEQGQGLVKEEKVEGVMVVNDENSPIVENRKQFKQILQQLMSGDERQNNEQKGYKDRDNNEQKGYKDRDNYNNKDKDRQQMEDNRMKEMYPLPQRERRIGQQEMRIKEEK